MSPLLAITNRAILKPITKQQRVVGAFDKDAQIPAYKNVPVFLHAGQEPQDGDLAEGIDINFNLYKSVESLANVDEVT